MSKAQRVWVTVALLAATGVVSSAATALAAHPRRWDEVTISMTRARAHEVLGRPDADFMVKRWEGWDQPALIGAWVLVVRYDEAERVVEARQRFGWGLGYLGWDRNGRGRNENGD